MMFLLLLIGGIYLLAGVAVVIDLEIRSRRMNHVRPGLALYLLVVPLLILLWPIVAMEPEYKQDP